MCKNCISGCLCLIERFQLKHVSVMEKNQGGKYVLKALY